MNQIVSITDFRRNAGAYIDKLAYAGPFIIIRGGKVVGHLIPARDQKLPMTKAERIEKVKKLAGGFKLGTPGPDKLNKILDQEIYANVLPR